MTSNAQTKTTLHFIRHADAMPDPEVHVDRGLGYDLLSLSRKGARQAESLARRVAATIPLIAIYSSPTLRARETAEAVARTTGLRVELDEGLREVYLGDESLGDIPPAERAAAVRARLAKLANIALTEGTWNAVPGAELGAHIKARMTSAVAAIVARHPEGQIALVSHAGSINAYIATVLGIDRDFFYPIGNSSLNTVRFYEHGPLVVRLNDTAHLEAAVESEAGQTEALHRTAPQSA